MRSIKFERIDGGKYKYRLLEQYEHPTLLPEVPGNHYVGIEMHGDLLISEGYCWDGASGPTIDTPATMRGSLVHDAMYQLLREGYLPQAYRSYADRLLRDVCIEDGMDPFRATIWYWAVRAFARGAAKKEVMAMT